MISLVQKKWRTHRYAKAEIYSLQRLRTSVKRRLQVLGTITHTVYTTSPCPIKHYRLAGLQPIGRTTAVLDATDLPRVCCPCAPFSAYKLAACFAENVKVIAITRNALLAQNAPGIIWRPGSARTRWGSLQCSLGIPTKCCLVAQWLVCWIRDREVASSTPGGCVSE